jgi:hypothetical protein
MITAIWPSKRVIKTGKTWNKKEFLKNKPKNISHDDWVKEIKNFKYEKLVVLDQLTKSSKKKFIPNDKDEE